MVTVTVLAVALMAAGLLVAPWRAWALDRDVARRHGVAPAEDAGVEEIALLAGGPRRVAETAVARLVEAGSLVVEADRSLHSSGRAPQGELDRAVLDASVLGGVRPTASGLVGRVRHTPAVEAVVAGARARGLLHDAAVTARLRRDGLLALGAAVLLAVVGAALLGGSAGAGLSAFLIAGGLMGVAVVVAVTGRLRPTRRGRATLDAAGGSRAWAPVPVTATTAGSRPGAAGVAAGAAALVAVGGFARFPDPEISRLLAPPPSTGGAGGGFVGGGDGGGGGCGGGDGGGGGGGAC